MGHRLAVVTGCVENAKIVADIGCDHGYVAQALVEQKRAQKVIACDISEKSLEKAKRLIQLNRTEEYIETRVGDGLHPLGPREADVIVIAGMGGMQMIRILKEQREKAAAARQAVLSPNRNAQQLRVYLYHNGYEIFHERLAKENGRFYPVICARHDGTVREEEDFYCLIGRKLIEDRDPLLNEYLEHGRMKLLDAMEKAAQGRHVDEYLEKMRTVKNRMDEVLKCLSM